MSALSGAITTIDEDSPLPHASSAGAAGGTGGGGAAGGGLPHAASAGSLLGVLAALGGGGSGGNGGGGGGQSPGSSFDRAPGRPSPTASPVGAPPPARMGALLEADAGGGEELLVVGVGLTVWGPG